jgi:Protein of unknown function (DUF3309)
MKNLALMQIQNRSCSTPTGTNFRLPRFLLNSESFREAHMLSTILVVILILIVIGALPNWGHSSSWGYGPSGGLGLILVIVIVLVLMGKI